MTLYILIGDTTNDDGETTYFIHGVFSSEDRAAEACEAIDPAAEIYPLELDELDDGYQVVL